MTRVFGRREFGAIALLAALTVPVSARTIVITDEDCDRMAVTSADAPRLGWAMYESSTGTYSTYVVQMTSVKSFLIRYPLDRIPRGQRITNAEWVVPVSYIAGTEPRLQVRRLLVDWGVGVCHKYRTTSPKKVKWTKPGARGISSDVALKPTATLKVTAPNKVTFSVTEDVELWYTGGAANKGWVMTVLDAGTTVHMSGPFCPFVPGNGQWKLRITYEPK